MGRIGTLGLMGTLVGAGVAGPLVAQSSPRRDLFLLRHGTDGAVSVYTGHSLGRVLLIAGTVRPPGPDHPAAIGAVGTDLRLGASGRMLVAVGYADVSSGRFTRVYLLPAFRAGRLAFNGTVSAQRPLGRRGVPQVGVDPAVLSYRASRAIDLGVVALASLPGGQRARVGVGPMVRVRAGRIALGLEAVRRGPHARVDGRLALSANW